jgi:hypothetical protein
VVCLCIHHNNIDRLLEDGVKDESVAMVVDAGFGDAYHRCSAPERSYGIKSFYNNKEKEQEAGVPGKEEKAEAPASVSFS